MTRQVGAFPAPALEGIVKGRVLIGFLETPTDVMDALADAMPDAVQPAKGPRSAQSGCAQAIPASTDMLRRFVLAIDHPDRCSRQRGRSHPRSACVELLAGER